MKFFRKKQALPEDSSAQKTDVSSADLYASQSSEESSARFSATSHRISMGQRPVRLPQNGNRASGRQLLAFVFKMLLIPVLLLLGYAALKLLVARIQGPSEADLLQWEENAALMDQGAVVAAEEGAAAAEVVDEFTSARVAAQFYNWEQVELLLHSANDLEHRGMAEEAIVRLQQALKLAPENRRVCRLLLTLQIQREEYEAAIPTCLSLLGQDFRAPDVVQSLLMALFKTHRLEAAEMLALRMLEDDPNNVAVMEVAAYASAADGRLDAALALYQKILAQDANYLLALEGMGAIYAWRSEWDKTLPYYLKLIELNPKAERYYALARSYGHLNEAGKAVIFLGQAAGLYGESVILPWLKDPSFDFIREGLDFRSFVDQVVGVEEREAIEVIRRREIQKSGISLKKLTSGGSLRPSQSQLQMLKPGMN